MERRTSKRGTKKSSKLNLTSSAYCMTVHGQEHHPTFEYSYHFVYQVNPSEGPRVRY